MRMLGTLGALGVGIAIGLTMSAGAAKGDPIGKPGGTGTSTAAVPPPAPTSPLPSLGVPQRNVGPSFRGVVLTPSQRLQTIRASLGPLGSLLNESNLEPSKHLSAQTPYIDEHTYLGAHLLRDFSPFKTADSDPHLVLLGYDGRWHPIFVVAFPAEANKGYFVDCQLLPGATFAEQDYKRGFSYSGPGGTANVSSSPVNGLNGHMFGFLTKASTPRQASFDVIPQSLDTLTVGACDVTAVRY